MTSTGLRIEAAEKTGFEATGMSAAIQSLEGVLREIAPTNIPILLVGEIGTGKTYYAQRIHQFSRKSGQPLLRIPCAYLSPVNLAEELGLNHASGNETEGQRAGSVFLDEIGDLDPACQRQLLYALPDGKATPRRGALTGRVISSTARNLDEEMRAGRFRSELYYRISGVCLRLPLLRERREDIPLLVEHFLTKHAEEMDRARPSVSARTMRTLLDYSWPGNIRELENVVKKIVALGDGEISLGEMAAQTAESQAAAPAQTRDSSLKAAARAASREAEKQLILDTLARTRWNRKRAAQELQISYKSLLFKLKQIGLQGTEES
ncbi:MAG TPA: sigma 54-interacting transcriptional regulator [Verrucomicrobiae bacterium]|nr:sigma 54-interacting transcriptional regulator [Verrucomicrobiae bacterium]